MQVSIVARLNKDRAISQDSMWGVDHIRAPFCTLHCVMLCSEHLLEVLQSRVLEQGGEQAAEMFNRQMKKYHIGFRIKRSTEDGRR